ncbi:cyclic lactone autoinducer peptide [Tissierella sp. DSM 105185]|uniref:Cyclic lactone autoinducer peptide n=1 Tax=Tissierella pigra TaxID=2607614 RepID=A0A6N7XZ08_9FIRM|nr:cyclic lactone autoinducer peptide [Tissierella pigra]
MILLKKVILRFGGVLASLALMVTSMNVNTTCMYLAHQPELPKGAEKLRKN